MLEESYFPVKCKYYESDKLLCIKGGYKVEKPKPAPKKARFIILHRGEAIKTKISGSRI